MTGKQTELHENAVTVLGVRYTHIRVGADDLYLTDYGLPFRRQLAPSNFLTDRAWFDSHAQKLYGSHMRSGGTGTLYRIRTKPVDARSLEIVLKWNRMAQEVPGYRDDEDLLTAEFNSPFEEFALLMEMRANSRAAGHSRIHTHKPLAIYVPATTVDPDRLGRKEYKMREKIKSHEEIELDLCRRYGVIYEWVKGIDIAEACHREIISEQRMQSLTLAVDRELDQAGFLVRDRKPQHIIIRPHSRHFRARQGNGLLPYALVDFELLERTREHEEKVRAGRRRNYLVRQAHRFDISTPGDFPPHLAQVSVFGVDYIFGVTESTGGALWVVGRDPHLFDYFLPERWEPTPRTRLSAVDEVYETTTKDDVHLVWKMSRVGRIPDVDPFRPQEKKIIEYGYNSPFEEVALALELNRSGICSTPPRAIYMTNRPSGMADHLRDSNRYDSHRDLVLPDGTALLRPDREYVTVWEYCNRVDDELDDAREFQPVDALRALRETSINEQTYFAVLRKTADRLAEVGIEDLKFGGRHKLLLLDSSDAVLLDHDGLPSVRICNFELMRRSNESARPPALF